MILWQAWVSDGLAHAHLVLLLICAACYWQSYHVRPATPHLSRLRDRALFWGFTGVVINAVLLLVQYSMWRYWMGG